MCLFGQMAANTKDNMLTTRNKALEYFYLRMEDATKDNGKMANNMVKVFFVRKMQANKVFGQKGKE